jgi:hypothetical protein
LTTPRQSPIIFKLCERFGRTKGTAMLWRLGNTLDNETGTSDAARGLTARRFDEPVSMRLAMPEVRCRV